MDIPLRGGGASYTLIGESGNDAKVGSVEMKQAWNGEVYAEDI